MNTRRPQNYMPPHPQVSERYNQSAAHDPGPIHPGPFHGGGVLIPTNLPGTGPMPVPVSNPNPSNGGEPLIVIPDPPEIMSGSSYALNDGSPVLVARAYYKRPRSLVAYIAAPYDGHDPTFVRSFQTAINGATKEVCILAEIKWGMAGAQFYMNCNVPLGQVVQVPLMAQSVDISARFIMAKPAGAVAPNYTYNLPRWAVPDLLQGFNSANIDPNNPLGQVVGAVAEGSLSRCNAERAAWLAVEAGNSASFFIPPFATSVRITGSANLTYKWAYSTADMSDIPTNAAFLATLPPGTIIPVPNSSNFLVVKNNGGNTEAFEVAFQISP